MLARLLLIVMVATCPVCAETFKEVVGVSRHLGFCLKGADYVEQSQLLEASRKRSADGAASNGIAASSFAPGVAMAALQYATVGKATWLVVFSKLRLVHHVPATAMALLKSAFRDHLSRITEFVLQFLLTPRPGVSAANAASLMAQVGLNDSPSGWPKTMETDYLEESSRAKEMPVLKVHERKMPPQRVTVQLPDRAEPIFTTVDRTIQEIDVLEAMQRLLNAEPRLLDDIKAANARIGARLVARANGDHQPREDIIDGEVVLTHELAQLCAAADGSEAHPWVCFFGHYFDEIGVENCQGAAHGNHEVMMSYWICLCFHASRRMAKHIMQLQCIALSADVADFGFRAVIGGGTSVGATKVSYTDPVDSASWGRCMQRFSTPRKFTVPRRSSSSGFETQYIIGANPLVTCDNPAGALGAGTKEGVGPNTRKICRTCDAGQGEKAIANGTHFRQINSFLLTHLCMFKVRTPEVQANVRREAAKLTGTALSEFMMDHGINHTEHAYTGCGPYSPEIPRAMPHDPMHVGTEGWLKSEGAAFIWILLNVKRPELGNMPAVKSVEALNARLCGYPYQPGCSRPQLFTDAISAGTGRGAERRPLSSCHLNMKAADVTTFVLHSLEILGPFIPDGCMWPEWQSWKLAVAIWRCVHAIRVHDDPAAPDESTIMCLDTLIREHNTIFLDIALYSELQKPKVMHYLTHLPVNGRDFGPWCKWTNLRFEGFHQLFKQLATAPSCTFRNLPLSLAKGWSHITALEWWTGQHAAHGETRVVQQLFVEDVTFQTASGLLLQLLKTAGLEKTKNAVVVTWCKRVQYLMCNLEPESWVLCKSQLGEPCLASVVAIFVVLGQYYVALNAYPGALKGRTGKSNGAHWATHSQLALCAKGCVKPLKSFPLSLVHRVPAPMLENGDKVSHFVDF